ncbi:exopolyphosphatase [Bifidobacterium parmae]|uniref:Exopolyphosphatase n=1 Tax=Bifidobacterium parmae TaxID=361854 RepID=A0A2N5IZT5_9BIFI|nr:exopolyphosphatase [Bifidobacterium parmae]
MVNLRSHTTRLGVLDIGSNTIHMLIVDAAPGARPDPEASTKTTVRLMQYLKDDGSIKKAGIEAILEAVDEGMKLAEEYEITQLLAMATSAIREAPNGNKVLRKIEERIG